MCTCEILETIFSTPNLKKKKIMKQVISPGPNHPALLDLKYIIFCRGKLLKTHFVNLIGGLNKTSVTYKMSSGKLSSKEKTEYSHTSVSWKGKV